MSQIIKTLTSGGPFPPNIPTQFTTDNATIAVPAANNINVFTPGNGIQGIFTSASGSTITIALTQQVFTGTATTIGNTTANINVNIPVPANSVVSVRANVAGWDGTSNLGVGGELIAAAKNVAGTVTILGTPDRTTNPDSAISDVSWTLIVSGTNVLVQVKGTANAGGTDVINWRAFIDIVTAP